VLAAVESNGHALEYAGKEFLKDKVIVKAAVCNDGNAL